MRCLFAILLAATIAGSINAQDKTWVGKTIFTTRGGIRIGHTGDDGKQVFVATLSRFEYRVLAEKDGWIKVAERGVAGWFDKADAVLLDTAIDFFTQRIRKNPKDAHAYTARGAAWHSKGEFDIAIKDQTEALRLDPSAYAYVNRGITWRHKKDYDKAIADQNEAIRLDPKDADAYHERGLAWQRKKEFQKAVSDYCEVTRLDPKDPEAYNAAAWLLATAPNAKDRNGRRALELAKKAVELEEAKDQALRDRYGGYMDTLAAAFAESGNFQEAVQWQARALKEADLKDDPGAPRRLELYRNKQPFRLD